MNRKQTIRLIWLCSIAYFVSYVCRINLAATLVEVVDSGFASTRTAALALTLSSLTYGAGQILSGWLGDRFKPQHMLVCGFAITGAVNLCVALLPTGALLPPLWAVNGFAQSLMWPPLVVIMSGCLNEADYQKAVVRVSWGSSFGTIAVYLLAPLLLPLFGLRSVFVLGSAAALVMLAVWTWQFRRTYAAFMPVRNADQKSASTKTLPRIACILIPLIMIAIMLQGSLRDGVSNWMPTYMSETFGLSSSLSILTGVILPLFSILSFQVTSVIHQRWLRNDMLCAAVIFGTGCLSALVLYLTNASSIILSVMCLALLVGSMHGVNLVLICFTPRQFARFGRTGLISGVLNSATYAGSALSGYGMALFSESFGWHATIGLWVIIALCGLLLCSLLRGRWDAFTRL
ncbi:MAG: MFS transporter [Clostridia bacterium]|nr:MFS transporter [Clostridia bacterium]